MKFLPICRQDLQDRDWEEVDIIIVSGDAYVDHPAWAAALLGRFMESHGYRVGIIAQPDWRNPEDITKLGSPRLFFAISSGNMDSMVNHYTADKKRRHNDMYSPGGQSGLRPDRAAIVYTNLVRRAFPGIPVVIGGVEASLRRLAHYDYWSDSARRSVLMDSKADLLVYGMGEYVLLDIARRIKAGHDISRIHNLRGTCYASTGLPLGALELPTFEEVANSPAAFSRATRMVMAELNPYQANTLAQKHGDRWVVQNPPRLPLTTAEMDRIYDIPFTRNAHPVYNSGGGIPALEPVRFSLQSHRGCFGGCAFCSLGLHQGKFIQNRSPESLEKEAVRIVQHPDFKGTIADVGGPSANMYGLQGMDENLCRKCRRGSCMFPSVCQNLDTNHRPSIDLLRRLRGIKGIKHLFVSSGVRFDLVNRDRSGLYLQELCRYHVSGQLKIAPEHISARATHYMHKTGKEEYVKFIRNFKYVNAQLSKNQYLIPYFMSGHPGCTVADNIELAEFIRDELQYYPEQVQNFTPTPMTVSTSMYCTGLYPENDREIYVPRDPRERKWQRAVLQYRNQKNQEMVREALKYNQRSDLIGDSARSLVKGNPSPKSNNDKGNKKNGGRKRK